VILERLPNERQKPVINEAGNGVLHHGFIFRQLCTDVIKIEWIQLSFLGGHGASLAGSE
jgi:hypothetical protein